MKPLIVLLIVSVVVLTGRNSNAAQASTCRLDSDFSSATSRPVEMCELSADGYHRYIVSGLLSETGLVESIVILEQLKFQEVVRLQADPNSRSTILVSRDFNGRLSGSLGIASRTINEHWDPSGVSIGGQGFINGVMSNIGISRLQSDSNL